MILDIVNNHYLCPFHCIDIDHQHVSEQGPTRFRTGSHRQVHMSEPGLLLLANYREPDRYSSFWWQICSRYPFDIPYHYKMTMFTNILATFMVEKQNIHNWIMSCFGTGATTRRRTASTGSVPSVIFVQVLNPTSAWNISNIFTICVYFKYD